MTENFDDRLDSEIDALLENASRPVRVEANDAALNELVQIAADLRTQVLVARPSEAGIQRGRARLLAELDGRKRGSTDISFVLTPVTQVFKRLLAPAGLAWRVAIAASLLVAGLALNGALGASADSLPGDPLYDLKRIQEQLRLSLTVDSNAREKLQEQIDETRITELSVIRRILRVTRTEIGGIVNAVEGNTLVVDHVPFIVDRALFPGVESVKAGDRVTLIVQTNSDGSVGVVGFRREPPAESRSNSVSGAGIPVIQVNTVTATSRATAVARPTSSAFVPAAQSSSSPTSGAVQQGQASNTPVPPLSATPQHGNTGRVSPTPETHEEFTSTPPSTRTRIPTPDDVHREPTPTFRPESTNTPRPTETHEPTATPESTRPPQSTEPPRPSPPGPSETREPPETREPTAVPNPEQTRMPAGTPSH